MPRPTLERTLKYITVVPRAQTKLGREARRGSHDLRKLVGHANFLDTLMEQLDLDVADDEARAPIPEGPEASLTSADEAGQISWGKVDYDDDDQWETADSDSSEDEEDELVTPEFDHENDEDHALSRTASHRDLVSAVQLPVRTMPIVTPETQHPIVLTAGEMDADEALEEICDIDKHIQELAEDYFVDKHLPQKRAQVAASLATFDTGTTLSAVSETA